jgi:6-phosphogluconolactonase
LNLYPYPDVVTAAEACGARAAGFLEEAISERGQASLAISGGSSPKPMYLFFSRFLLDWSRVHLFWVDERGVPPSDSQSNFKFANETWLLPAKYPPANIHRIRGELDAQEAARLFEEDLRKYFELAPGQLPSFDVMHLGMGPDAHTASLFPGEPMILNRTDITASVWVEKFKQHRITLLPGVIAAAAHRVMLVAGEDKIPALENVLKGDHDPLKYPAQIVPQEGTDMFLDEAAAKAL